MPETRTSGAATYREAGVDRESRESGQGSHYRAGAVVTHARRVIKNPGGFGGLFRIPRDLPDGVLVASADGVGTKLKIAMLTGRHDTVGHDLVNHCVNDILVEGAQPLFFLDYIGMGRLETGVVEQIVAGMVAGCRENGCALIGGETAEMPDFYAPGEYDLAGFIVGVTSETQRPGAHQVKPGDVVLGLAANGFHTNGYTLLRRVLFDRLGLQVDDEYPGTGRTVGAELLRVHRSYLHGLLPLIRAGQIHALAHITGGGIIENLERVVPAGLQAEIAGDSWALPPEFVAIMEQGPVERSEMFATFNMGIGMIVVVDAASSETVRSSLEGAEHTVFEIGRIQKGSPSVVLV